MIIYSIGEYNIMDCYVLLKVNSENQMQNQKITIAYVSDMEAERNALMTDVFPLLKDYCRERHSIEFQVVDMRWGVPADSSDRHSTVSRCMDEIKDCQTHSIGPNFVVCYIIFMTFNLNCMSYTLT